MTARIPAAVPYFLFLFYDVIVVICGILLFGVVQMWPHFRVRNNLKAFIQRAPISDTNGKNAAIFFGTQFDSKKATLAQVLYAVSQSKKIVGEDTKSS